MDSLNTSFALPNHVKTYLALIAEQQKLRESVAKLKPEVQEWIMTLPKQSLELSKGSKLKVTSISRYSMNQEYLQHSLKDFLIHSKISTPPQAESFAKSAAQYVYSNRPKHTNQTLQRTYPKPSKLAWPQTGLPTAESNE
jgi:hypothetical protein